jgi:hypothetical protein
MTNWKRALLAGSVGASVVLFLKGKWTAGILCAGVGLATAASEYPEEFARFRENLPNYVERGTRFVDAASRAGERLARYAQQQGRAALDEMGSW